MSKEVIITQKAPAPIGPYNQAVLANGTLYISGQIAINPITGSIESDTIERETQQVMRNISAILEAAGFHFEHIVKTSIFLRDMDQFQVINETYGKFFESNFPARETVEVSRLPKNVNVEISCIAVR